MFLVSSKNLREIKRHKFRAVAESEPQPARGGWARVLLVALNFVAFTYTGKPNPDAPAPMLTDSL